jgi:riboflavin kinase / FMN adenylyltransferase
MTATVFRSLDEAGGHFGPCALAIGNFDGVHIGHQALIRRAVAFAAENRLTPAVLTFDPHPTAVVAPDRVPEMICTLDQRLRLLSRAGAQRVLVLPFTVDVARLSPEEFVSGILVNVLQTKGVFVGDNFRFGYKQAGTPDVLQKLSREYGFACQFIHPVHYRDEIVSSSSIRRYLNSGNVSRAGRLLGHCFALEGLVVAGHGMGRSQTVPTLNLRPVPNQIMPDGVYITETTDGTGRTWPSITNVGVRPTFDGEEPTIETYLLAPLNDPVPGRIEVQFRRFVRPERRFPDAAALRAQILKDVTRAQEYWRRLRQKRLQGSGTPDASLK